MAVLTNNSSGDFTTAGTWSLIDSTSYLNTEAVTDDLDTVFRASQSFVPGAITIDGIGVKVARTAATPTGTFTVRLFNSTDALEVDAVTINAADLPVQGTLVDDAAGWVFMDFGTTHTLLAGKSYTVDAKVSVDNSVYLFRTSPTYNWARYLRTTTNQAPVAGDDLIVTGEHITAGTANTLTVTMDNTTSDTFGEIEVNLKGVLKFQTTASTNYHLKLAEDLTVFSGGSLIIGESGTPMPDTSTAKIEFVCSSNVEFGLRALINSTVTMYGATKTTNALLTSNHGGLCNTTNTGGNVVTRLSGPSFTTVFSPSDSINIEGVSFTVNTVDTADQLTLTTAPGTRTTVGWQKPGADTALTSDVSTGWKAGDQIGIAPTAREYLEAEKKSLSIDASGTSLTLSVGLDYYHNGTAPEQAELINLTRNIQIFSASTTNQTYAYFHDVIGNINYVEFYNMGSSTSNKRGINLDTATGIENTFNMDGCAIHDFNVASAIGLYIISEDNFTINNCVTYNTYFNALFLSAPDGNNYTISNSIFMRNQAGFLVDCDDLNGTFQNLTATGAEDEGFNLEDQAMSVGTVDGLTAHSNRLEGVQLINITGDPRQVIQNITSWNNDGQGLYLSNCFNIEVDTATIFGNNSYNVYLATSPSSICFKNLTVDAGDIIKSLRGVYDAADLTNIFFDNCVFGQTTEHTTADVQAVTNTRFDAVFRNCLLASTNKLIGTELMTPDSMISFGNYQQVTGDHRTYFKNGLLTIDTTIFNNASPSARITPEPLNAGAVQSTTRRIAAETGETVTVEVWVRKSSLAADGVDYNGSQPTLILQIDSAIGVTADTVLDTATSANGVWEKLTGTTPAITDNSVFKFHIKCDGTAGFINIDDWDINNS